ncbi:MAG: HyaD/HybD family hydrogenase maturation endopeptidase [Chloroflexi bacterium]|nr:HyaD/HybD family hydrogenase maturation endopeptidase [Chloroflexota bacterium]
MKTLILGLGNILLQDEGVGVRVIEHLQANYVFPDDVLVLDGGTLGLDLLAYIEDSSHILIVDAVKADKEQGALIRLVNDEIPAFLGPKVSPHQVGLQDLLALAKLRGHFPDEVILWGVQADIFEPGLELNPKISAQVEPVAKHVLEELARWNVTVQREVPA